MKIGPIAGLLDADDQFEHILIHTGQHYDDAMFRIFFEQLKFRPPDHLLNVGSGSHAAQTARTMERLEPVLCDLRPDVVLVPGDVNSTLATALVAAKLGFRLGHVEAGLRSFDRRMPEELNRVVTDALADLLFVHSPEARTNLINEGAPSECIYDVGNTMIDSVKAVLPLAVRARSAERLGLKNSGYILVTLHRPMLTDGRLLREALDQLCRLAKSVPVVFPVHPRTRARMNSENLATDGILLLEPLGYIEFISLVASSAALLTDSGGVQEEATFLDIPCFTLRENTERPVTIRSGTNHLLGLNPERIADIPRLLADRNATEKREIPGWDGFAAKRIIEVLRLRETPSRTALTAAGTVR
jgi:UDP-N-acetylglucosamine 2-epimerase (non-hydrolysing)